MDAAQFRAVDTLETVRFRSFRTILLERGSAVPGVISGSSENRIVSTLQAESAESDVSQEE